MQQEQKKEIGRIKEIIQKKEYTFYIFLICYFVANARHG